MNTAAQVTAFNFNTSKIRVVTIDDQPWFVAADVCRALGLNIEKHGAPHYLGNLGEEEKTRQRVEGMRGAEATLISESGLYKLGMRSDKQEAKGFQDWVAKEVLPSIRKTGSFVTGQPSLVENPQMSALYPIQGRTGHHSSKLGCLFGGSIHNTIMYSDQQSDS